MRVLILVFIAWGNLSAKQVTFRWKPVPGADHYRLQVAKSKRFSKLLVDVSVKKTRSRTALKLGRYIYRVCAVEKSGTQGRWATGTFFEVIPNTPRITSPARSGAVYSSKNITLQWRADRDEGDKVFKYELEVDRKNYTTKEARYQLKRLKEGKHSFRVRAVTRLGMRSAYSRLTYFHVSNAVLTCKAPVGGDTVRSGNVQLSWESPVGFSQFVIVIYKGKSGRKAFKRLTSRASKLVVKFLAPGDYRWQVTAKNMNGVVLKSKMHHFRSLNSVYF